MILDEIAARVSGDMVNAGIASIDALWCSGQPLDRPLATYTRIAHAATRRHTAGLWTLIAWIYWRRNDLRSSLAGPRGSPGHRPRPGPPSLPRRVHAPAGRPRPGPARPVPLTQLAPRLTPCRCAAGVARVVSHRNPQFVRTRIFRCPEESTVARR